MLPDKLKVIVKSISNGDVTLSIYRLGDLAKIMEMTIDKCVMASHTVIVDDNNSQRPAEACDLLKGNTFTWNRKVKFSKSQYALGTFIKKEALKAGAGKPAFPSKGDTSTDGTSTPSGTQKKANQDHQDNNPDHQGNKEASSETSGIDLSKVEVREIKDNDDPNSIQQKLRQKAEAANIDETLKAFADKYVK